MKIAIFNWNGVLDDVEMKLVQLGHTILPRKNTDTGYWKKADVIVVWNEVEMGGWAKFIRDAQKAKIRTILVQHGRRGTSRIYPPFNELPLSKTICVWGENDKQRMVSCGVPAEHIIVTGTPILKHLKPRVPHKGINVVFCPEHWDSEVAENFIVADELRKLKKVNVVTKALEGEHRLDLYDNVVVSKRGDPDHFAKVADVLSTADVIVSLQEGTFELLAQSLDIPVVLADIWIPKACDHDDRYKEYRREYSDAVVKSPLKKLNENIM